MFDQEGGDNHAHAVVRSAGCPELSHAGIDKRVSRGAVLPGSERVSVVLPWHAIEPPLQAAARQLEIVIC